MAAGGPGVLSQPLPPRLSSSRPGASSSPVRPLLALESFCRRWGLAAPHSGTPGPSARRRGAGWLAASQAALRRGERTERGARLALLALLGDKIRLATSLELQECIKLRGQCHCSMFLWPQGPYVSYASQPYFPDPLATTSLYVTQIYVFIYF